MAKIIISRDAQVLQEVQLDKERMTIGRHPHNDIVIEHRTVSGQHAAITTILNDAFLEDLGSTNGTFVNGQRITKHVLDVRDQVMLAKFQLQYLPGPRATAPAAALPPPARVTVEGGPNAGKGVDLAKPVTTLGRPGVLVVVIARKATGYYLNHIDGTHAPTVNGLAVGADAVLLADGDRIDLAGTIMVFSLTPVRSN
ncbi:MAG: FHA domain-containing protein [Pseudomonadota bacterium]